MGDIMSLKTWAEQGGILGLVIVALFALIWWIMREHRVERKEHMVERKEALDRSEKVTGKLTDAVDGLREVIRDSNLINKGK